MNRFCVAVVLGLFTTVVLGCATSSASTKSTKSCEFSHKGNGGVLNQKGGYIEDSVLVWVDIANNCFRFVSDPNGRDALNAWNDASEKFNVAMKNGDEGEAFRMLEKANDNFKAVAPFISKSDLKMYFMKVNEEFGALLKTKNLQDINDYMTAAYPQFKNYLGCKND